MSSSKQPGFWRFSRIISTDLASGQRGGRRQLRWDLIGPDAIARQDLLVAAAVLPRRIRFPTISACILSRGCENTAQETVQRIKEGSRYVGDDVCGTAMSKISHRAPHLVGDLFPLVDGTEVLSSILQTVIVQR